MIRRRFAMPCSFSSRKTATRYGFQGQFNLHSLYIIKQTATDYLPDMLQTYLTLPTSFARFHRIRGQKTPQEILIDQLDILDQEMKQIVIDIHSRDTDLLIAHGKFLRDKFEKGDSWLD